MLNLTHRNQIYIASILIFLLMITREFHFASWHSLPGATWAVFFLAGFYLKPKWVLPGLLMLTWVIDFSAFKWGTGSDFCLTSAYAFLIPAYSALWLSGFWYARHYQFSLQTLLPLMTSVFVGALLCELVSSGSFYLLSGHFSQPGLAEFVDRELVYFPAYLLSMVFYIALAALIHIIFTIARSSQTGTKTI